MRLLALPLLLCTSLAWAAPAGVPDVVPEAVQGVAFSAVGEPEVASGSLLMRLAPGGQMLAVSNGAAAWLYLHDARRRFAVTPVSSPRDPRNMAAVSSIEGLRWGLDGRLYAWARLFNGQAQVYAADRSGPLGPVLQVPEHWPDEDGALAGTYPVPDPDNAYEVQANDRFVVWRVNRGHGSMRLMAGSEGRAPRVLAEGGWELQDALLDAAASRVLYPADAGVLVHPLAPGAQPAHIEGTLAGDRPLSFDAASRWLVLLRPQGDCSAAARSIAAHVCFVQLPSALP